MAGDRGGEVAELLQVMIRNACVNDGSPESGHEQRNAEVLRDVLEGPGLDLALYEPLPGRTSLVARVEGRDRAAPALALLGHTDVVPANADDWRHDPFGGEIIDGEVWGRGAVDMLNLTSSMAVSVRHLADEGFRPEGDLLFIGVADEEALGVHGAQWLTEHLADEVRCDYLITEAGGFPMAEPRRRPPARHHRGERRLLVHHDGAGNPRARLATASHRQRVGEGRRGRAPSGRARDAGRHPRRVATLRRGHRPPRGVHRAVARPRPHRCLLRHTPRARPRPSGPRLHPHHHGPHGHERRKQGQRDPGPGAPAGRHPDAARLGPPRWTP